MPTFKRFKSEAIDGIGAKTVWLRDEVGDNTAAKREVMAFNESVVFSTPKPEALIARIVQLASQPR